MWKLILISFIFFSGCQEEYEPLSTFDPLTAIVSMLVFGATFVFLLIRKSEIRN